LALGEIRFAARALVIVPATGGRGFSRSGAQAPLILFEISGAELMRVASEQERDDFIKNLVKRAAGAIGMEVLPVASRAYAAEQTCRRYRPIIRQPPAQQQWSGQ
jgi:hypothetical protein